MTQLVIGDNEPFDLSKMGMIDWGTRFIGLEREVIQYTDKSWGILTLGRDVQPRVIAGETDMLNEDYILAEFDRLESLLGQDGYLTRTRLQGVQRYEQAEPGVYKLTSALVEQGLYWSIYFRRLTWRIELMPLVESEVSPITVRPDALVPQDIFRNLTHSDNFTQGTGEGQNENIYREQNIELAHTGGLIIDTIHWTWHIRYNVGRLNQIPEFVAIPVGREGGVVIEFVEGEWPVLNDEQGYGRFVLGTWRAGEWRYNPIVLHNPNEPFRIDPIDFGPDGLDPDTNEGKEIYIRLWFEPRGITHAERIAWNLGNPHGAPNPSPIPPDPIDQRFFPSDEPF